MIQLTRKSPPSLRSHTIGRSLSLQHEDDAERKTLSLSLSLSESDEAFDHLNGLMLILCHRRAMSVPVDSIQFLAYGEKLRRENLRAEFHNSSADCERFLKRGL